MGDGSVRAGVARIVDAQWFGNIVIAVIVLNGISLGMETYEDAFAGMTGYFRMAEHAFVAFFVIELALKVYARGWTFFRDPWNWFDLIVVGVALIPASEGFSVLRLLRILRLLRLISVIPHMREIVSALFRSVPGLGTVIGLLFVIMYTSAVLGEKLFEDVSPEYFGDLGTTLYTLFMLLTTENWPDISDSVTGSQPMAWIFFVVYIVVSAFIVLNLVIAVIITSLEQEVSKERWAEDQELELEQHNAVMAQLGTLTEQVARLSEQVRALGGSPDGEQDGLRASAGRGAADPAGER
ncbi:voltage-gated sodium channel [Spinactinospora alkalitolerans]|uniref:Voltage-gated sodium channel n=1 Tax=Spinactinospora alkalitolerans TaxID=687207 RepID=A0A852TTR7_9ACTN|nr:ion transporter [Spinactinospora alkalitolerans]NYE45514.1 voltage-gated sodium channel [Spinactinospora alkalitolerans]